MFQNGYLIAHYRGLWHILDNMLSIKLLPPDLILRNLGRRARERRLQENLSRKTLASKSGVPEATIKRFELLGRIGTESLLLLAIALDCPDDVDSLFEPRPIRSIADVHPERRRRGRQ
jgi:transcriptional regulator with XRE-family HTH domain